MGAKGGEDSRQHGGGQQRKRGKELDEGPEVRWGLQWPTDLVGGRV